ncbi:hypothetical protein KML24004_12180 [Alistipes indistinctus]
MLDDQSTLIRHWQYDKFFKEKFECLNKFEHHRYSLIESYRFPYKHIRFSNTFKEHVCKF